MDRLDKTSARQEIECLLLAGLPPELRDERTFADWYDCIGDAAQVAAMKVYEEVGQALQVEQARLHGLEGRWREVWILFPPDGGGLTKTANSVRSKIGRQLREAMSEVKSTPPTQLTEPEVRQMVLAFPDLGRFRIVGAFPADVSRAIERLVPAPATGLLGRYVLKDARIKDYVFDLALRKPAQGHRARQFAVAVAGDGGAPSIFVEIQFMTTLQHAWDRRNHPFYEWTREGGNLPPELVVNDVAVAETLHLADQQAGRNWEDFLRHVHKTETPATHP